jgi:hypothetical protein
MLPLEPSSVVPAGREVSFDAVANSLVLMDGFAWRLIPMVVILFISQHTFILNTEEAHSC